MHKKLGERACHLVGQALRRLNLGEHDALLFHVRFVQVRLQISAGAADNELVQHIVSYLVGKFFQREHVLFFLRLCLRDLVPLAVFFAPVADTRLVHLFFFGKIRLQIAFMLPKSRERRMAAVMLKKIELICDVGRAVVLWGRGKQYDKRLCFGKQIFKFLIHNRAAVAEAVAFVHDDHAVRFFYECGIKIIGLG